MAYVRRALVLVDKTHLPERSNQEKELAIRTTAEAIVRLPGWMQVIMVETGQSFEAVPSFAVSPDGGVLGQYAQDRKAVITPTHNKDQAYIIGHETGHHADAMLGGTGYFSDHDTEWKKAVRKEFAYQRSLPPAFRYHHAMGNRQMELYSRITYGKSYQDSRDREALASLLGDYFACLARGDTSLVIDQTLSHSLPHMWPCFRDEVLPRLASLAIEKYEAASRAHMDAFRRASDDPERRNLPDYDPLTENQSMHDLRASFGPPLIDRVVKSYAEYGAVMPLSPEVAESMPSVLVEPLQAEWPYGLTRGPHGPLFDIDQKTDSLAEQFGAICHFHDRIIMSLVGYVNSLVSAVHLFSGSRGYSRERSRGDLFPPDVFHQPELYLFLRTFLKMIEQPHYKKEIDGVKEFMSATDRHIGPVSLLRFFADYVRGIPWVSEDVASIHLFDAVKKFRIDATRLAELGTAMAVSPELRDFIQRKIDEHAGEMGLPCNPVADAVSFVRTGDFYPTISVKNDWPLASHLAAILEACGVTPHAVAHVRERIATEFAEDGNRSSALKARLGNFVQHCREQGVSENPEARAAFLKAFAEVFLPAEDAVDPGTAGWKKAWRRVARRLPGGEEAQNLSRINAISASTATVNSVRLSDAYLKIATDFGMVRIAEIIPEEEVALRDAFFAAGRKYFHQFGAKGDACLERIFNSQNDDEIREQTHNLDASTSHLVKDWWMRIRFFSEQLRELEPATVNPAFEAGIIKHFFDIASMDGPQSLVMAMERHEVVLAELVDRMEAERGAALPETIRKKPSGVKPVL